MSPVRVYPPLWEAGCQVTDGFRHGTIERLLTPEQAIAACGERPEYYNGNPYYIVQWHDPVQLRETIGQPFIRSLEQGLVQALCS